MSGTRSGREVLVRHAGTTVIMQCMSPADADASAGEWHHADPLLVWGTYDISKPRVRLLLEGLKQSGVPVREQHVDIWSGVRDKGTLDAREQFGAVVRWLRAIPTLVRAYLRAPAHSAILVPYLGLFDVLVIAPIARWRGVPVVWDIFISPYDTVVNDRRLLSAFHPLSLALYATEWIASRAVARSFIDTRAHAERFERLMGLRPGTVGAVPLGTDPTRFPPRTTRPRGHSPFRLFFYGQYIPLHGLETIIRAAKLLEDRAVHVEWVLAGTGQEQARITALIAALELKTVRQLGWVASAELPRLIDEADVGLGIFGTSDKALTVVPNKVYELAATQTPIITGDTPALREFADRHPGIDLVTPGDAEELAACVARLVSLPDRPQGPPLPVVGPREVGAAFLSTIRGYA